MHYTIVQSGSDDFRDLHLSITLLCGVHMFVQGLKCLFITGVGFYCMSLIHLSIKHSRTVLKPYKLLYMQQNVLTPPAKAVIVGFLSFQLGIVLFFHAVA